MQIVKTKSKQKTIKINSSSPPTRKIPQSQGWCTKLITRLCDLLSAACLFYTKINIKGNDFHLIVNYYAFAILNSVVSEMKTSTFMCVEMTC